MHTGVQSGGVSPASGGLAGGGGQGAAAHRGGGEADGSQRLRMLRLRDLQLPQDVHAGPVPPVPRRRHAAGGGHAAGPRGRDLQGLGERPPGAGGRQPDGRGAAAADLRDLGSLDRHIPGPSGARAPRNSQESAGASAVGARRDEHRGVEGLHGISAHGSHGHHQQRPHAEGGYLGAAQAPGLVLCLPSGLCATGDHHRGHLSQRAGEDVGASWRDHLPAG
mmetsp:Transcript_74788/g.178508  ORF Transcript_74788/g.178508 Transcript_74788/m.178508 type:complete len:221 (+) Transcript_74788:1143-1805(+)